MTQLIYGKNPVYVLELAQKSNFQPSTTKSDNIDHLTIETVQIFSPLCGSNVVFFLKNKKL
jgi:hypothetical protein